MTNFDFCVWHSLMICLLWGAWFQCISIADQGGCPRRLKFFDPVDGKRLEGHVFLNLSIEKYTPCEFHCLLESRCLSANIGPSMENNKVTCQLNDADHLQHPDDLKDHPGWTYRGTENACSSNPCFNKGTCAKGSSDKTFVCSCPAGYTGEQCERDIDECTRGTHKCSDGAVCNNTKGGYNCTCKPGFEGDGQNCQVYPKNCAKVYQSGNKISGVYKIDPDGLGEFEVFCDQTTAGGGWTVFQKRFDGSVDFYRRWDDYKRGFGNLTGEFWLGLDKIHRLTVSSNNSLRVDLEDLPGNSSFAEYSSFAVGNETEKYKLSVKGFSGTAGDALAYHRGFPFTTKDSDNDGWSSGNCALTKKGGWWYGSCYASNLNGQYMPGAINRGPGMNWYYWKNSSYSAKRTEMKIRPKEF